MVLFSFHFLHPNFVFLYFEPENIISIYNFCCYCDVKWFVLELNVFIVDKVF